MHYFITLYDAACTWATEERCVGSDDEREITVSQAAETTAPIMKEYMSKHTYKHDLKMMLKVRGEQLPKDLKDLSLFTLVPSFTLTQIQKGLLTGMFIYLAFVFIDLIISTL